jgi:hypothetical protein
MKQEAPTALDLLLGSLAVLRATHFLIHDQWPPMVQARNWLSRHVDEESVWMELSRCSWCQGLWISPLVALSIKRYPRVRWLLLGPALSGVVGLLSTADSALARMWATVPAEREWEPTGPGEWRRNASL